MAFRKIEAGLVQSSVDNFIGRKGTIFYDNDDGILRLSDGVTPGGNLVNGGGSGGDYTLPTASTTTKGGVKVDGTTITISNQIISAVQQDLSSYATQSYVTSRGYLTSVGTISYNDLTDKPTIPSLTGYATETFVTTRGYLTTYTETDPVFTAWDKSTGISITESQISDLQNYLTTETDPVFTASDAAGITNTDITNWGTAYSWGNHADAGYLTSTAQIVWVNPIPTPQTLWRNSVTANSTGATISLITGLPGIGSEVTWTFDEDKIKFPDNTEQTTAFTGSIAYASVSGTPTLATVATSGSYTDLSNKPTIPTVPTYTITTNSASGNGSLSLSGSTFTFTPAKVLAVASLDDTQQLPLVVYKSSSTQLVTASGNAGYIPTFQPHTGGILAWRFNAQDATAGQAGISSQNDITAVGSITANGTTAFVAGTNSVDNVALQMSNQSALRNIRNGANTMYFDTSTGGASHGDFQFRSSNSFTNVLTMSPTAFNVNPDATVTARTPSFGRLPWNSAIDTELTIDNYRFRISNQGGIFPQIISNVGGQTRNSAWTAVGAISGDAVKQAGSTGNLVPNNSWVSLYTLHGMDAPGDTVTVTLQDKQNGRIYRVTFMRSDDGATTGYNIIAERLL